MATANAPASNSYPSASLYAGDLHPDVTEAQLFEVFREIGPVVSIRVCRDAITRRSLGYAYVNFQNAVDAERALEILNYTNIKGRPVRLMWSHRDPSVRKSGVGNIFIKNMDKTIDNKALYDTFSAFGNILSCKVSTDKNGNSRGFGFVHFETQEAAEQAIVKVNGMLLAGKKVYVGDFIRKSERMRNASNTRWTNIYTKNFAALISEEDLEKEFSRFGEITSIYFPKDDNDKPRGFAFINFKTHESAADAVENMDKTEEINGKKLETPLYVARAQKKEERQEMLRKKFEQLRLERLDKYQSVNLYIKHLDETINDEQLKTEFSKYGEITSARVMTNDKGGSKGFGFVCFKKPDEAQKAITEMNGRIMAGKPIYVALAQRKEVRRAQLEAQYAQRQAQMRQGIPPQPGMPPQPMYPGPVFYAPQPGMPQRGFYPPPGMVRPRWDTSRGGKGGRFQPAPGYSAVASQQRSNVGGPSGRGGRGGKSTGGNGSGPGYKFNRNVRNPRDVPQPVPGQMSAPMPPYYPTPMEPLTPSALAQAPPELQKHILGERLFPLVMTHADDSLVPKITGMLLEMDNGEIIHLIESPEALKETVHKAVDALKAAQTDEEQTPAVAEEQQA